MNTDNYFPFSLKDGEINGIPYKYYEIPTHTIDGSTTILYRGDTDLYPDYQKPTAPAFFSTEPKFVKHYGIVFRFRPIQTLKLLALDNSSNYSEFYDSLENDHDEGSAMQRILRENYGYNTGSRFSEYKKDYKLVNYLCEIDMDGYAINRMDISKFAAVDEYEGEEHDENRKFHPEMAICDVNKIEYVDPQKDIAAYAEKQIEYAKEKKRYQINKYGLEDERKNKSILIDRPSFKGKSLFGDDDDDYNSPPSTPKRGGKTRKIRARKHNRISKSKVKSKSKSKSNKKNNKKKSVSKTKLHKRNKIKRSTKKVASKKSKGRSYKKKA